MDSLYAGTILYMAGCYCGVQQLLIIGQWAVWAFALFVFAGMWFSRKNFLFHLCMLAFLFICGWACGLGAGNKTMEIQPYVHQQIVCYGHLEPLGVYRNEYSNGGVLQCKLLSVAGREIKFSGRIVFSTKDFVPESGNLYVTGVVQLLHPFRNPGVFDMEVWQRIHGPAARITQARVTVAVTESTVWEQMNDRLALWNRHLRQELTETLPGDGGQVLSGMFLGGSSGIREEVRENFSLNGLSHILSVSGTHLLFLAGLFLAVLPQKKSVKLGILMFLLLYAGICGFRPPVLRAWCMLTALLCSTKRVERGRLLCLVAILLLIFQPLWILDVGFQLSFSATAGLIWLMPKLKSYCATVLPVWLAEIVAVTTSAQLATVPFAVAYFHQFSLVAVLANVIILPILTIACLWGLISVLLPCGTVLLPVAGCFLDVALHWADWLAALPGGVLTVPELPVFAGIIYCLVLIFWFNLGFVRSWSLFYRLGGLVACLVFFLGLWFWRFLLPGTVKVSFLDVHQGDCAVIQTSEGHAVLVDTGGRPGFDVGSRVIVPFLRSRGITKLSGLFLSHWDSDHSGGAVGVLRNLPTEKIILPAGKTPDTGVDILDWAGNAEISRAKQGDVYVFDDICLRVLDTGRDNKIMTVLGMEYGDWGILFTGDMDAAEETSVKLPRTYTIVKAAHHGSKYSNSDYLYRKARPELTVISVGADNRYGHPHQEAVERIAASGSQILRTDLHGMVEIEFDRIKAEFRIQNTGRCALCSSQEG